jgi:LPS-assembly lipoprotein
MYHHTPSPFLNRRRGLAYLASVGLGSVVPGAALTGCGFKLRGAQNYAFTSILINTPAVTDLVNELQRGIQGNDVKVLLDTKQQASVQVVLDILSEQREKVTVATTSSGQVREFQLRLRLKFRLRTVGGKDLIEETELLQQRDISFSESAALSKEVEEAQLYRNMQSDIVQQLSRRLAAVRTL